MANTQLNEYFKLKDQIDNKIRLRNRELAKQAVEQEINDQIEDEYLGIDNLLKNKIQDFLQRTFQYYGGNPFQVKVNQQAIKNTEMMLISTRQQVLKIAMEIDVFLSQQLQLYTPEQLLEISPRQQKISLLKTLPEYEETEEHSQDEFDMLNGMKIQQELLGWTKKNPRNVAKSHSFQSQPKQISSESDQQYTFQYDLTVHTIPDQDNCQTVVEAEPYPEFSDHIDRSYQELQPERFDEIDLYDRREQTVFSRQTCESDEIAQRLNDRFNSIKQSLQTTSSSPQQTSDLRINTLSRPIIEENSGDELSEYKVEPRPKKVIQNISLVGSLFTSNILREIQQLNDIHQRLPPVTEENTHQSQQTLPKQKQQVVSEQTQRNYKHSQFKYNLLCEIRNLLEQDPYQEQTTRQPNTNQQMLSKAPQIFEFMVQLGKELQAKQKLNKNLKERIRTQYNDIAYLTRKQPEIVIKTIQPSELDIGSLQAWRSFPQVIQFFTPSYIQQFQSQSQPQSQLHFKLLSILMLLLGLVDKDFKLYNLKMPVLMHTIIEKIDSTLIKGVLSNPSKISVTFKNLHNILIHKQLSRDIFQEFEKSFAEFDDMIDDSLQELKSKDIQSMLKMLYYIKYYLDCLNDAGLLKFNQIQSPILNYEINQLYQEHIWKQQGHRNKQSNNTEALQQKYANQVYEKYGIDFMSWEVNLKIQEDEIKMVQKTKRDLELKQIKFQKQMKKIELENEQAKQLSENQEQSVIKQCTKLELDQFKKQGKSNKLKLQSQVNNTLHLEKIEQQKSQIEHEHDILMEECKFQESLKEHKSQSKHSSLIEKKNKLTLQRQSQLLEQQQQKENLEEERVWRKAQEMLQRQKLLLNKKEECLRQLRLDQ